MNNPQIDDYGTKYWYDKNRKFHREDAPAIEYTDGTFAWRWHGKYHRDNGEFSNVIHKYFFNGKQIK